VRGKGNPEWNFSGPHGAGRLMSRSKAKESLSVDDFRQSMDGIFTTCVGKSTIDESPMAYKPMDEIIRNIHDTAEVVKIIKPVYNFKAAE
jgi:RNA-splicing ligase RtcB